MRYIVALWIGWAAIWTTLPARAETAAFLPLSDATTVDLLLKKAKSAVKTSKSASPEAAFTFSREALTQALALAPYRVDILLALSQLSLRKGEVSEAVEFLNRGLEINPKNPSLLFRAVIWSDYLGRAAESKKFLKTLKQSNPPRAEQAEALLKLLSQPAKVASAENKHEVAQAIVWLPESKSFRAGLDSAAGTPEDLPVILKMREQSPASFVVVTGSSEFGLRHQSEVLKSSLLKAGVTPALILEEPFGRNLAEVASHSINVLLQNGARSVTLVVRPQVALRALKVFQLTAQEVGAPLSFALESSLGPWMKEQTEASEAIALRENLMDVLGVPCKDACRLFKNEN